MKRPTLRERLLSKAVINMETGCWEWTACKDRAGYGKIGKDGATARAHRVAYELIEGPIPDGLVIDHLCRNTSCINPAHLEPVTAGENTLRSPIGPSAINARLTHCKAGHPFDDKNTRTTQGDRRCRACDAKKARDFRAQNPELDRARQAAYREKNREQLRAYRARKRQAAQTAKTENTP